MATSSVITNGNASVGPLVELGVTGLKQWGGVLYEEWLPELQGTLKHRVYREMSENEPIIAASLMVYEMLIRNVTRGVEPATKDAAGLQYADWLDGALYHDQSSPFSDFLSEAIQSMLVWGVGPHELVYKIRGGDVDDPTHRSMYHDYKYGWRKWPIRAYETLDRWDFDDRGGVRGLIQFDPTIGRLLIPIPIDHLLLFRMRQHKGSPEGLSLLRPCYTSWYCKKHLQIYQNIGFARNLAGIPMMGVPPNILSPTATGNDLAMRTTLQQMITALERDQIKGFLFPLLYDAQGHKLYEFSLLSPSGTSTQTATAMGEAIKQYNLEMLLAMMTAVILIGHEQVGAKALHSSATQMLSYGLSAILDGVFDVLNRVAIPRLWRRNDFPQEYMPTATHEPVETVDLDELGNFIVKLSQAGFNVSHLETELMNRSGLPQRETEAVA